MFFRELETGLQELSGVFEGKWLSALLWAALPVPEQRWHESPRLLSSLLPLWTLRPPGQRSQPLHEWVHPTYIANQCTVIYKCLYYNLFIFYLIFIYLFWTWYLEKACNKTTYLLHDCNPHTYISQNAKLQSVRGALTRTFAPSAREDICSLKANASKVVQRAHFLSPQTAWVRALFVFRPSLWVDAIKLSLSYWKKPISHVL